MFSSYWSDDKEPICWWSDIFILRQAFFTLCKVLWNRWAFLALTLSATITIRLLLWLFCASLNEVGLLHSRSGVLLQLKLARLLMSNIRLHDCDS